MEFYYVQPQTLYYPPPVIGTLYLGPYISHPVCACNGQFHVCGFQPTPMPPAYYFEESSTPQFFPEQFEDRFWGGEEAEMKIGEDNTFSQPQQTVYTDMEPHHVQPEPHHVQPEPHHVQPEPHHVQPEPHHVQPEPQYSDQHHVQQPVAPMENQERFCFRGYLDAGYDPEGIWVNH